MHILSDLNTSTWDDCKLKAVLDFLYGDTNKYMRALDTMDKLGTRKPTVMFKDAVWGEGGVRNHEDTLARVSDLEEFNEDE